MCEITTTNCNKLNVTLKSKFIDIEKNKLHIIIESDKESKIRDLCISKYLFGFVTYLTNNHIPIKNVEIDSDIMDNTSKIKMEFFVELFGKHYLKRINNCFKNYFINLSTNIIYNESLTIDDITNFKNVLTPIEPQDIDSIDIEDVLIQDSINSINIEDDIIQDVVNDYIE